MNNLSENLLSSMHQQNLSTCSLDQLFELTSTTSAVEAIATSEYFIQFISILIASFVGFCSILYGIIKHFSKPAFKLHFIGIRPPNNFSKSQFKLLDNVDTQSTMITVETTLTVDSTILDLKNLIRKTYNLDASNKDILISYSNHIISFYQNYQNLTLFELGITDNSLLTLAVCNSSCIEPLNSTKFEGIKREINEKKANINKKKPTAEPVHSINQMFEMFQDEDDEQYDAPLIPSPQPEPKQWLEPFIGFDVIMQEENVVVYRMPSCGHEMNRISLYSYAVSSFTNNRTLKLKCPHRTHEDNALCNAEWDLTAVLELFKHRNNKRNKFYNHPSDQVEDLDLMKLELLFERNLIETGEQCNVQKCPHCKTLYFKNKKEFTLQLSEIKTINDLEKEFKVQCIYCKPPSSVNESNLDINSDLSQAASINKLFDMFQDDSDSEIEEEEKEEEMNEAIQMANTINDAFGMFVDDDDEDKKQEEEEEEKYNKNASFCFGCGSQWNKKHICDDSFRDDLAHILQVAEKKKIGKVENVPSIRCCPTCCQLLFHIDCCKHMRCKTCNTSFCMVCLKPKLNGKWQCGSSSSVCPIAPIQDKNTLPDHIVLTKQQFKLFEETQQKKDLNDEQ